MKKLQWVFFLVGTWNIFTLGQPTKKGSPLRLTVTVNDTMDIKERIELDAATNSIVLYNKTSVSNTQTLSTEIKAMCKCAVEHLEHLSAFVLRYTSVKHMSASEFLEIDGVEDAYEDILIEFDIGKETKRRPCLPQVQKSINQKPNDELFNTQWALHKQSNRADINWEKGINAYMAHPVGGSPDGPSVTVAVIDSGVDYTHPDLQDSMWVNKGEIPDNGKDDDGNGYIDDVHGYDFVNENGDPMPGKHWKDAHGTHCSGIIAASYNNKIGITGVVGNTKKKVKIMAVKIMQKGPNSLVSTMTKMMRSKNYAVDNGAKISSNSYGTDFKQHPERPLSYYEMRTKMLDRFLDENPDHLYVGSAGNAAHQITDTVPHLYSMNSKQNHVMVGNSNINDEIAPSSNWGKPFTHVMAPGSDICSTIAFEARYQSWDGTSMAAPHVAGLAALVRSMDPDLRAGEVKDLIEKNVQKKKQYKKLVTSGGLICFASTIRAAANKNTKSKPESCD